MVIGQYKYKDFAAFAQLGALGGPADGPSSAFYGVKRCWWSWKWTTGSSRSEGRIKLAGEMAVAEAEVEVEVEAEA